MAMKYYQHVWDVLSDLARTVLNQAWHVPGAPHPARPIRRRAGRYCGLSFVDIMADGSSRERTAAGTMASSPTTPRSEYSQETAYMPIRVLGRGAFGEAVLYRRVEVGWCLSRHVRRGPRPVGEVGRASRGPPPRAPTKRRGAANYVT